MNSYGKARKSAKEKRCFAATKSRLLKEARIKIAEQCKLERAARSPQEQIELLDARLGKGVGAVRERARLQKQVAAAEAATAASKIAADEAADKSEPKPKNKKK